MTRVTTSESAIVLSGPGALYDISLIPDSPDVVLSVSIRRGGPDGALIWQSLASLSQPIGAEYPEYEDIETGGLFAPVPIRFDTLWIGYTGGVGRLRVDYIDD